MKYIKIVPLSAFGANFNYSIWYVEVRGIKQEAVIQRVCSDYENVSSPLSSCFLLYAKLWYNSSKKQKQHVSA